MDISFLRSYYRENNCTPKKLAEKVIDYYFKQKPLDFPMNIFEMLSEFGVFYEYRELDKLEGAYSPETEEYEAAILINKKRPYTRQRFTCAHELCHHIKDFSESILCPFNKKNNIEKFADQFAGELLMPKNHFMKEARKIMDKHGIVDPNNAYQLCLMFGTSYQAIIWKLYNHGFLSFKPNDRFFRKAKPQKTLGQYSQKNLLEQIVNSYTYFPQGETSPLWQQFKNELVFHDSRIEGINLEQNQTSKLLIDLRMFGEESEFYQNIKGTEAVEVVGHSYVYEYIMGSTDRPDRYEMCELNSILYSLTPYGSEMGQFRKSNNKITGASIQTVDYHKIELELFLVEQDIDNLLNKEQIAISDYLYEATQIHHRITQIHPFENGNGRISRAVLNWLLKVKDLPPIYVPYENKDRYVESLEKADNLDMFPLYEFFLERLLNSFIVLNDELSLIFESEYLSNEMQF